VAQADRRVGMSSDRLVFVSYSHDDAKWRRKFLVMLQPLVRNRGLDVWADEYIEVGDDWERDITGAVDRAALALLLVSPEFLASRFIMDVELPALLQQSARLVCVLVRPSLWEEEPALRHVQWAHDPERDGALSLSALRERTIVSICRRVRDLLPATAAPGEMSPAPEPVEAVGQLAYTAQPGRLHGVPAAPPAYVERAELTTLRSTLLEVQVGLVGLTGSVQALGLHGQGGIGKSVLAAAVALDPDVAHRFPDGLFWVTLSENADLVAAQIELLRRLGVEAPDVRSASQGTKALRAALADRRCLLIIDDVWSDAAATAFHVAGAGGRVLYTTRDPEVLRAIGACIVPVEVLPEPSARELLARLAGTTPDGLPSEVDRVLVATGRVALALALVGAAVGRGRRSWTEVAEELERGSETFLDHPYADTFKAMRVGMSALPDGHADLYRSLAVYPEDTQVPIQSIARLWHHLAGRTAEETREVLHTFADRGLLLSGEAISFHDLQRDFLLLEAEDLAVLHADLLDAYRTLLPARTSRWSALPPDEPYIWGHLLHHLRGAGERAAMLAVVHDLGYITMRWWQGGPYAAESDLRQAAALHPDDDGVRWSLQRGRQLGHLSGRLDSVADLAATFASRLESPPAGIDLATLNPLLPTRYLVPRWGLAPAPGLRRMLDGRGVRVSALVFSPDGHTLAGYSGGFRLWDTFSRRYLTTLEGHTGSMWALAFSPDGRTLAGAGGNGLVHLWDSASGRPLATLEGHTDRVNALAFSPDGRILASASEDRAVRLWDGVSGRCLATLQGHTSSVDALAFFPDGRTLASAAHDLRLWDPTSGRCVATFNDDIQVQAPAFSPDGRTLAGAGGDGLVHLWDSASGRPLATLEGQTHPVRALTFSPAGRILASVGDDGAVHLWDPATGRFLERHPGPALGLAFSRDGTTLASASTSDDNTVVCLWDRASRESLATVDRHIGAVQALALSPDGRILASAGDEVVRLWDPASGRSLTTLAGHTDSVRALALSPDGRLLASAGHDQAVHLWDTALGCPLVTLNGHTAGVNALAFSPGGHTLASAGDDHVVRLWDPASGRTLAMLEDHTGPVNALAFSPDGRILASAGDDPVVRLWDPASGHLLATLTATEGVNALAFSPDGRAFASVGDDGAVRLWDPASGRSLATLEGHTDPVRALAFSPDGRTLASVGEDEVLRLWDAQSMEPLTSVRVGPCFAATWGSVGLVLALGNRVALMSLVERN
jgi:WD40 repeat protein